MFRRLVCAVVVLVFGVGLAVAAEIRAYITKIDGDKITYVENKGKGEKGDTKTVTTAANVKVIKGKINKDKTFEPGDAVTGGLKNEMFSKIGEKGISATLVTDADNKVTEVRITGGGKKGKGQ